MAEKEEGDEDAAIEDFEALLGQDEKKPSEGDKPPEREKPPEPEKTSVPPGPSDGIASGAVGERYDLLSRSARIASMIRRGSAADLI